MDLAPMLGLIGTLIDLVRAGPQLFRLLRERKAFGVSVDTAGTSCIVSTGWAAYGVVTGQPFVIVASGMMAGIFLLIAWSALRFGRSAREFKVAPLWLMVLLGAGVLFGINGLGAALSVSALASSIPQIRVAYRESDLSGLSLGTWLLALSSGLVWGIYGLLQRDASIITSAVFQCTTSGIIIALKMTRPGKVSLPVQELGLD